MSLQDHQILGLTVHSPHAELTARGLKTIENRSWAPPGWMLGRYIALHASRTWDHEGFDYYHRNAPRFALGVGPPTWEECKFGIVAVARLVGWVQRTESGPPKTLAMLPGFKFGSELDPHGHSIDWRWFFRIAEYGWVLRDIRRLRQPVAVMGRQKLWQLPPLVYKSVRAQWKAAA